MANSCVSMEQKESSQQSSQVASAEDTVEQTFCRLCRTKVVPKFRRLIFSENTIHVVPILVSVLGSCSPSDEGSSYLCMPCFTRVNKIHRLDTLFENYKTDRQSIIEELKRISPSSIADSQKRKEKTTTKRKADSRFDSILGQYHNILPRMSLTVGRMEIAQDPRTMPTKNRQPSLLRPNEMPPSTIRLETVGPFPVQQQGICLSTVQQQIIRPFPVQQQEIRPVTFMTVRQQEIRPSPVQQQEIRPVTFMTVPQQEIHPSPVRQSEEDRPLTIQQPQVQHVEIKQEPVEDEENVHVCSERRVGDNPRTEEREPFPVAIFEHEVPSGLLKKNTIKEEKEDTTDLKMLVDFGSSVNNEILVNSESLVSRGSSKHPECGLAHPETSGKAMSPKMSLVNPEGLVDPKRPGSKQNNDDMQNNENFKGLKEFRFNLKEKPYKCRKLDGVETPCGDEKPLICSVCASAFDDKGDLVLHMKNHDVEKPYTCSICGHRSIDCSAAIAHRRTHSAVEKPHKCSMCEYRAASKSNVIAHLRTHTGEKPYKCTYCDYRCANNPNLKRHMVGHRNKLKAALIDSNK